MIFLGRIINTMPAGSSMNPLKMSIILLALFFRASSSGSAQIPVVTHELKVRNAPSLKGKIIATIGITDRIYVIKSNRSYKYISGHKGRWIYIDTRLFSQKLQSTIKGWVFDYYIGYYHRFRPLYKWTSTELVLARADTAIEIRIHTTGKFVLSIIDYSTSKTKRISREGRIHRYLNVIQFPLLINNKPSHLYLYLDKDNQLTNYKWGITKRITH